ncbi:hypothetical protein F5984_01525 [Rudanella paleaurantiibacter]|uniref:Copper resistance protein NlpE n=1 Tax=Rudanella paleaurantiibacter TaxID=2614655 RepID=A0A7J5U489_9BACT|nr:hypothetical protein [Rudanella paleaurantiibacter]KAB7732658.1 hypothetical protein F5984_01525 [Rudanella paleaurantiibacter]
MKTRYRILLAVCCLGTGCQQERSATDTEQTTQTAASTKPGSAITTECYAFASPQDSVRLKLVRSGNTITGELLYRFSGKDQNTGTITGSVQGDTILANYTFESEGQQSVREVVFLRKGNKLAEGYGPVQEKDQVMAFIDRSKLSFDNDMLLTPVPCIP